MQVGDVVMFVDEGNYSKWFWGKIARIESVSGGYCQVRWLQKVRFKSLEATTSNFNTSNFKVLR